MAKSRAESDDMTAASRPVDLLPDDVDDDFLREADQAFRPKVSWGRWLLIVLALLLAVIASMCLGRYTMDPTDLVQGVYERLFVPIAEWSDESMMRAIFDVRLPRVIAVVLVGAALAVAGASYQGMFKNPLVSPDLLGASAGASLGACIAMLLNMSNLSIQVLAFVFSIAAVGLAVWLTRIVKSDALLGLVLGGILVSTVFQSGTSVVKLLADSEDKLPQITFWLMGSFNGVTWEDVALIAVPMLVGFTLLLFQRWKLNVMSFGEEEARTLGIDTSRVRLVVILSATLVTASTVAIAGIVGYVGLVVPHLARAVVGPNYRVLLPASMAIGAAFLLVVDNFCRLVFATEIPIGIMTSVIGVPFFIFIYRRNMRGW